VADTLTNTILHLEIQKGRVEMVTAKYADRIKATAANVLRMAKGTKRVQNVGDDEEALPIPKQTFLRDSWFSSIQAASAIANMGDNYIGVVKTNYACYPKKYLEETMKLWPAGSHLVMETTTSEGITLLAIGYKYNRRKVLCFLATEGAGHTEEGTPYEARWKDDNNNTMSHCVPP
jgi:hypothetical protein